MRIKCVSSNIGTVDVPGCGVRTFQGNQIYDLPDDEAELILLRFPRFFKRLDPPSTAKPVKQSYTSYVKTKIGFDTTSVKEKLDPDNIDFS